MKLIRQRSDLKQACKIWEATGRRRSLHGVVAAMQSMHLPSPGDHTAREAFLVAMGVGEKKGRRSESGGEISRLADAWHCGAPKLSGWMVKDETRAFTFGETFSRFLILFFSLRIYCKAAVLDEWLAAGPTKDRTRRKFSLRFPTPPPFSSIQTNPKRRRRRGDASSSS